MRAVQTAGCWAATERMKRGTPVQTNCDPKVREAVMRLLFESAYLIKLPLPSVEKQPPNRTST